MARGSGGFNSFFQRFALVAGFVLIFGLPAIFWVGSRVMGFELEKAVQSWFSRVFAHSAISGAASDLGATDGSSDSGGD